MLLCWAACTFCLVSWFWGHLSWQGPPSWMSGYATRYHGFDGISMIWISWFWGQTSMTRTSILDISLCHLLSRIWWHGVISCSCCGPQNRTGWASLIPQNIILTSIVLGTLLFSLPICDTQSHHAIHGLFIAFVMCILLTHWIYAVILDRYRRDSLELAGQSYNAVSSVVMFWKSMLILLV